MALPRDGSLVGAVLNSYLCDKKRKAADKPIAVTQCSIRGDSVGPSTLLPPMTPPRNP